MLSFEQIFLDAFSEEVEDYAMHKTNKDFYNSGESHAHIVLNNIVKYSENTIKIYCGNLCTDISNSKDYLNNLTTFFKRKTNTNTPTLLEIILCEYKEDLKDKDIFNLLKSFKAQVKIKTTDRTLYDNLGNKIHFTVADKRAYRIEVDTKLKKARCNFNDNTTSEVLENAFDNLFKDHSSKDLSLA